jgi:hypothetical protein
MEEFSDSAEQMTDTPEGVRRHIVYRRRRDEMEAVFLAKLRAGEVLASAVPRGELMRRIIPPSGWAVLNIGYDLNDIGGGGQLYEAAEFFKPPEIPLNVLEIPDWFRRLPTVIATQRSKLSRPDVRSRLHVAVEGDELLFEGGITIAPKRARLLALLAKKFREDWPATWLPSSIATPRRGS